MWAGWKRFKLVVGKEEWHKSTLKCEKKRKPPFSGSTLHSPNVLVVPLLQYFVSEISSLEGLEAKTKDVLRSTLPKRNARLRQRMLRKCAKGSPRQHISNRAAVVTGTSRVTGGELNQKAHPLGLMIGIAWSSATPASLSPKKLWLGSQYEEIHERLAAGKSFLGRLVGLLKQRTGLVLQQLPCLRREVSCFSHGSKGS